MLTCTCLRPAWAAATALLLVLAWSRAPARAEAPATEHMAGEAAVPAVQISEEKPKKKEKKRGRASGWQLGVESSAAARAGALQGEGTRTLSAAVLRIDAEARPEAKRGPWRLRVPIDASHRETQGASLDETRGSAGVALRYRRGPELRVSVDAEVSAVWRPDWPDLYQPLADGSYATTDRYSHWDRELGVTVAGIPLRHHHARAKYEYSLVDYRQDPSFDALDAPNHLVPSDHDEHALDLSWRYFGRGWKAGIAADMSTKSYHFVFSRDALTGRTHAGAGGPPPNPLQELRGIEPALSLEREWRGGDLELDLSYGYEIQQDTFEGYYSYTGHHPEAKLAWMVRPGHELSAKAWLRWRTYGPNSYAAGTGHPPLTYGDRRVDRRGSVSLGYRLGLGRKWAALAEADMLVRRTNFPPYEPGVFPASRDYDIDWNYQNGTFLVGIERHQ